MPRSTYPIVSGILLLTVITIAYGGTFVLSVTRGNVPANDLQKSFFRAGHAHAGVLVILGLLALTSEQVNHVRAPYPAISRDHAGHLGCGGPDTHRVLRVRDWQQPNPAKRRDRPALGWRRRPDYRVDRGQRGTGRHRFRILNDPHLFPDRTRTRVGARQTTRRYLTERGIDLTDRHVVDKPPTQRRTLAHRLLR